MFSLGFHRYGTRFAILTQAGKSAPRKLGERPMWTPSVRAGILFAGDFGYDTMQKLALHRNQFKIVFMVREGCAKNGSERAASGHRHTCSGRFLASDRDHSSTARIDPHARPRKRAIRDREPARGLFFLSGSQRAYRAASRSRRRAIFAATRAPNGSPALPETGQGGEGDARRSDRSCEQRDSGSRLGRILRSGSGRQRRETHRANGARHVARITDVSPTRGRFSRWICRAISHDSRQAAFPLARFDDRFRPPFHSARGYQEKSRRHGSDKNERLPLAPVGKSGFPRREQEVSKIARNGFR